MMPVKLARLKLTDTMLFCPVQNACMRWNIQIQTKIQIQMDKNLADRSKTNPGTGNKAYRHLNDG